MNSSKHRQLISALLLKYFNQTWLNLGFSQLDKLVHSTDAFKSIQSPNRLVQLNA